MLQNKETTIKLENKQPHEHSYVRTTGGDGKKREKKRINNITDRD